MKTRDARGRPVKLLDPVPMHVLGHDDVIDVPTLAKIADELEPGVGNRRKLLLPLLLGVGALLVVGIALAREGRPAWNDVVTVFSNPAILVVLAGGVVVPILTARLERLRKVRRVMLGHRRCPHCGYRLEGLPVADDATTVCPECGSAWRLDEPLGRALPERPRRRAWLALLALLLAGIFAAGLVLFMST